MHENEISGIIVNASIAVHRELGSGLLESIYEDALYIELTIYQGLKVEGQTQVSATYKGHKLGKAFRTDLIVEDKVIVELKSVEKINKVYFKQVNSYLKLTGLKLGLLINFNEVLVKNGISRIVNNL